MRQDSQNFRRNRAECDARDWFIWEPPCGTRKNILSNLLLMFKYFELIQERGASGFYSMVGIIPGSVQLARNRNILQSSCKVTPI